MLEVKNIHKSFGPLPVLKDINFSMEKGETLGVLGESGCGKSTLMKILMGLLKPDGGHIVSGDGLTKQMIFQDPYGSLDPRLRVSEILKEFYAIRGEKSENKLGVRVEHLLSSVDLPAKFMARLPHELSGGECQRVAIARALSASPDLLICDEPTSSLDLLTQARMLNLFLRLNKEKGLAMLFVTHDRKIARHLCDRVFEMKEGRLFEISLNSLY